MHKFFQYNFSLERLDILHLHINITQDTIFPQLLINADMLIQEKTVTLLLSWIHNALNDTYNTVHYIHNFVTMPNH